MIGNITAFTETKTDTSIYKVIATEPCGARIFSTATGDCCHCPR